MSTPFAIVAGIAFLTLIVNLAVTFRLVRLMGNAAREIKSLQGINPVMQGQITGLGAILTQVLHAMDDTPRERVIKPFETMLANRTSVTPALYTGEDKKSFDNAFSMTLLAIVEEFKPKQPEK
jgi:hypothetical protein